jgi:site-specific recombinase XerD
VSNSSLAVLTDRALALVAAAGARAPIASLNSSRRRSGIRTRRAYARASVEFFDWLAARGVTRLAAIESVHVAAYIEQLQRLGCNSGPIPSRAQKQKDCRDFHSRDADHGVAKTVGQSM